MPAMAVTSAVAYWTLTGTPEALLSVTVTTALDGPLIGLTTVMLSIDKVGNTKPVGLSTSVAEMDVPPPVMVAVFVS